MTAEPRFLAAALALSAMAVCAASDVPTEASAHPAKSAFAAAAATGPGHATPRLKRLRRHQERRP